MTARRVALLWSILAVLPACRPGPTPPPQSRLVVEEVTLPQVTGARAIKQWRWTWPLWRDFGGWSDLRRIPGQDAAPEFYAVSDQKWLLHVRDLTHGGAATAADVTRLDVDGDPESIAPRGNFDVNAQPVPMHGWWLGVEGKRSGCIGLWNAPECHTAECQVRASDWPDLLCAHDAIANKGPEAMAFLERSNQLLAIREQDADGPDVAVLELAPLSPFRKEPQPAHVPVHAFAYPYDGGYQPTAAAACPATLCPVPSALVLERLWQGSDDKPHGSRIRVVQLPVDAQGRIVPTGQLAVRELVRWTGREDDATWDNFEGLEVVQVPRPDGKNGPDCTDLYVLSDDNLGHHGQHTLLLQLRLGCE